jgi:uncharacterized membrane protein
MDSLITIIAIIFVFILPGFVLSYVFFKKRSISRIERLIISFLLSVAIVPLIIFYINLVGVKITGLSVSIEIILIILVVAAILLFKELRKRK